MKFVSSLISSLFLAGASTIASAENYSSAAINDIVSTEGRKLSGRTMSADMFRRILFQLYDIDTVAEFQDVCELSDERLKALRELQAWLIEYEFDGDVPYFKDFKEKSVWILFALAGKDPETQELGFEDFLLIVSVSGISGLSFEEILDCVGNSVSLSHDEILYIFCLGDPHFRTWQGAHFDYHGQCDLVMIQNPDFELGKGLDLHVRTEQLMPEGQFSYVSDAALRIGNDILEVSNDGSHYLNGQKNVALTTIGGHPVTREVRENCLLNAVVDDENARLCSDMLTYDVQLAADEHIQFKVSKDMVHVEVKGLPYKFQGSVGLMGTYPGGGNGRFGRDGTTVIQDANAYGQDWQVNPAVDGALFHDMSHVPQYPQQCTPPSETHASNQRKLRAGTQEERQLTEAAHQACDHLLHSESTSDMHKNCIFDVMATGDAEMAVAVYGHL